MLAGPPRRPVVPPAVVLRIAGDRPVRVVWENEHGGLTFEIGSGSARQFVKWHPRNQAWRLAPEVERLRWAASYAPVPEVIDAGHDAEGAWLLTRALPGESAVSERWKADPETAVRAVGAGLRRLHDTLPVAPCPFSWSADDRITVARRRADGGQLDPSRWDPIHQQLTIEDALAVIGRPPSTDRLVVCHGDACAPNTLIADDGRCSGHVDLGALGLADRWADLAIATWSTEWNYGTGWEDPPRRLRHRGGSGAHPLLPPALGPRAVAVPGCHTYYPCCMTMLSFRVDDREADEAQRWAEALGIDRSELLREALRRHLDRLASEGDAERWAAAPLDEGERALGEIADWGPAEDWSDWAVDAAG